MVWGIYTIIFILLLSILIIVFEWKQIKELPLRGKVSISVILLMCLVLSFFNLEELPGPITVLKQLFGQLGKLMT